jgi:uncharacterized protein YcbK (DUF882 family)
MKQRHGHQTFSSGAVDWKAARRARERLLAIGLGLVAFIGTGLYAAVDQLYLRDAPVQATCAPSEEGGGTSPKVTPVAKFREPVAAQERVLDSDTTGARSVERSGPPLRRVALEQNSASQDEPRVTGSVGMTSSPTRADRAPTLPTMTADTVTTSSIDTAECPLPALRDVLADTSARFGAVIIVATHQLKTVNHRSGSIREGLHHDCKAVDFRPDRSRIDEIKAYLRRRHEIGGIESYPDGVVHMDLAGTGLGRRLQTPPVPPPVHHVVENAVQRATTSIAHVPVNDPWTATR